MSASAGEGDGEAETIEEAAAAMLLGSRESGSLFGIGNMFRRFRYRASAPDSDGTDNEEETTEPTDRMEEDESEDDDDMNDESVEGEDAENVDESAAMADDGNDSMIDVSASKAKNRSSEATARTVSISEEDYDDDF